MKFLTDVDTRDHVGLRQTAVPADGDVATGEAKLYIETTVGDPKIKAKIKDSAGTPATLDLGSSGGSSDLTGTPLYVEHGTNAAYARPSTTRPVWWIGTVLPNNMEDTDVWFNPSGTVATATGVLALRPAASAMSAGSMYFASDDNGGTLYRTDGTSWTQMAPGVSLASGIEVFHTDLATTAQGMPTGTVNDVVGLTGTIPSGLDRPVMVECFCSHVRQLVSGGAANLYLTDSSNAALPNSGAAVYSPVAATANQDRTLINRVRLPAGWSGVVKARIHAVNGGVEVVVAAGFTAAYIRAETC